MQDYDQNCCDYETYRIMTRMAVTQYETYRIMTRMAVTYDETYRIMMTRLSVTTRSSDQHCVAVPRFHCISMVMQQQWQDLAFPTPVP